jgi:hypothetical protein
MGDLLIWKFLILKLKMENKQYSPSLPLGEKSG